MNQNTIRAYPNSSHRETGRTGTQRRNKDKLGPNSGPMGVEDQRKDKFGSSHNQDPLGLLSPETRDVRSIMSIVHKHLQRHKRNGRGSR